ncbi:MAG TPA: DUF2970 domain-containing protein [Burkholderiaceae bacterium]|nr:DUF2970 domain-containing protein [Burkholderiaceae bacterium]
MDDHIRKLTKRKLNFFQTLKAVAWGMFGVRKKKGHDKDTDTLNPIHLIIAGVIAAVVLVVALIKVAGWLVSYYS